MQIGGQELRAGDYGREETAGWFIFTHFCETLSIIMDTILRSCEVVTVSLFGRFNCIFSIIKSII